MSAAAERSGRRERLSGVVLWNPFLERDQLERSGAGSREGKGRFEEEEREGGTIDITSYCENNRPFDTEHPHGETWRDMERCVLAAHLLWVLYSVDMQSLSGCHGSIDRHPVWLSTTHVCP